MPDFSQPVDAITVEVPAEHAGQRIDAYLPRRFNWRSRAYFDDLLSAGTITVNGLRVKKAYRIRAFDHIALRLPESYRTPFDYKRIPLHVLHEDSSLVVLNKPGNLAVQPTGRYIHENLLYRLRYHYREERALHGCDPCIVHRLDRETSGVIVFAKGRDNARQLAEQFASRTTRKFYLAIVHGHPPVFGTIDRPLLATQDRHVVVDERGKPALTRFRVLSHHGPYALVCLQLLTGRQHQLRVHLASIGHPIVADLFYGPHRGEALIDDVTLPRRHMLHAFSLQLSSPTGQRLTPRAPLPGDMARFIARQY